ncbi:50S ribosomal protein L23 [Zostera marina]|uniref:Large ribosomal subunit protein uL23m n=1 Tax=Zostera marina TaxID=29655 RepID=A0A0K9PP07_ZOSMR|nr:50S ribosomal protein L23 [Zostera marina]
MGTRLGKRIIHFANLPIKLILPTLTSSASVPSNTRIREFAVRTIPSATKFEIKSVLESLYGFDIDEVRTLNMEGKKKKRGGILLAKPDYKKAYVTLKFPLSLSSSVFPIPQIQEQMANTKQYQERRRRGKISLVEVKDGRTKHWMEKEDADDEVVEVGRDKWDREKRGRLIKSPDRRERRGKGKGDSERGSQFPWSSMR